MFNIRDPVLLLMGHAYMILLVMLCQSLVYREVTALFSLKRHSDDHATHSGDGKPRGRDPWSKTLNWYFFAVANYYLYGESIIYYFKVLTSDTSFQFSACSSKWRSMWSSQMHHWLSLLPTIASPASPCIPSDLLDSYFLSSVDTSSNNSVCSAGSI